MDEAKKKELGTVLKLTLKIYRKFVSVQSRQFCLKMQDKCLRLGFFGRNHQAK